MSMREKSSHRRRLNSGTDELRGLVGMMTIDIADGKRSYDFEHTIKGQ